MSKSSLSKPEVVISLDLILDKLAALKPEVKSLRVDYATSCYETRILIKIPPSLKSSDEITIPTQTCKLLELFDANSFTKVPVKWKQKGGMLTLSTNVLKDDKYVIVLRGLLPKKALDEIVSVHAPLDPLVENEIDKYWLHSAIKDLELLERIYSELLVDRVALDVRVGVNRSFSTAIPEEIDKFFFARAQIDNINLFDRQKWFRTMHNYTMAKRALGNVEPMDIFRLIRDVVCPKQFQMFIEVSDPYRLDHIYPTEWEDLIPGQVTVGVNTDLNFDRPAAEGSLVFRKTDFKDLVSEKFKVFSKGVKKALK